jgi:hypothetical protein
MAGVLTAVAKKGEKPISAKRLRELLRTFPWDEWNAKLAPELAQVYRDVVTTSGKAAAAAAGAEFDAKDPFLSQHMTEYLGERITQLSRTSKKDVTRVLARAMADGKDLSPAELQDQVLGAVRKTFKSYEAYRALRIARTESAIGFNHGNVLGGVQAGFEQFDVVDGTDDKECARANGDTWPADRCLREPIAHPNAIFAGTRVCVVGRLTRAYRARWSGPAIRLRTARGAELTISPNHPVLTSRGWIPAKAVHQGDYVIHHLALRGNDAAASGARVPRLDLQDAEAPVEQVFEALLAVSGYARVVATPTHFHGDGNFCQGEVDIVGPDGLLTDEPKAAAFQETGEPVLVEADAELQALARKRATRLPLPGIPLTAPSGMGRSNIGRVGGPTPQRDPGFPEAIPDDAVADAALLRELQRRGARKVALDQVTEVADIDAVVGHAFDLETASRSYFADGLLVHNCVRTFYPHVEGAVPEAE